jgi:hypothetical protein
MGASKDWGWGSRQNRGSEPFQDRKGKGDPWHNHRNAQAARKHEESERKIAAWVHVIPRQKGGKLIKQRVKGTRLQIEAEVRNLRASMRGDADVVIHTWMK